jgi:peptidoglycan hydrolase-like protein with peptidoglycan-binding domain
MFLAVLVGFSGLGYGVAKASESASADTSAEVGDRAVQVQQPVADSAEPRPTTATATPTLSPKPRPKPRPTPAPSPTPSSTPSSTPVPTAAPAPTAPAIPKAGPPLLQPGDHGPEVRELQARLRQIDWFSGDVTDFYGPQTTESVRGFQAKREIAVTGYVDQETRDRLRAMTHEPTAAELQNKLTPMGNAAGRLDARCTTGRVLCIDKSSRTLRWVVDGKVLRTLDVRFGSTVNDTPTREGLFHVYWMDADHVSNEYGSAMPYSMFFSGGQAVHYSSDFASRGYDGASHGCVNVRDYAGIQWLFGRVHVGDKVVVYWS